MSCCPAAINICRCRSWFLCICSSESVGRGKYDRASAAVSGCGTAFGISGTENIGETVVVLGADIAAAPRGFLPGLIWTAAEVFDAGGSTPTPPTEQQCTYVKTGHVIYYYIIVHPSVHLDFMCTPTIRLTILGIIQALESIVTI